MATIDLTKIQYYVTAVLSDGRLIHLENVAENIAWEENEKELAARLNLTLRDIPFEGSRLSKQLALCTIVYVYAKIGDDPQTEVFRGTIWEWENSDVDDDEIIVTAYDMLYYLEKSTSSMYWPKGESTESICKAILDEWSVPSGEYSGPDYIHEKTLYKNKNIHAMLTETLEEAKKKTGVVSIIRAANGLCEIVERGQNADIWSFAVDKNIMSMKDKYSMTDLVTRVVIYGKDDKQGRPKVEATIDGKTEYGILQAVKTRGSTSLEDAQKEAQETLDEKGTPTRTITIVAPDIPTLRKGDLIYVKADRAEGYFYVKGVGHNATSMSMQMEVEPYE